MVVCVSHHDFLISFTPLRSQCDECCSCWDSGNLQAIIEDNSCNEIGECCPESCAVHPTACIPAGSCDDPPNNLCVDEESCTTIEACTGASDSTIGTNSCTGFQSCRDFTDGSVGGFSCNEERSCQRANTDIGSRRYGTAHSTLFYYLTVSTFTYLVLTFFLLFLFFLKL